MFAIIAAIIAFCYFGAILNELSKIRKLLEQQKADQQVTYE